MSLSTVNGDKREEIFQELGRVFSNLAVQLDR